ncbi:RNA polymerase sigma factor [Ktedonospora formicarum]|uniref:RNA polymerase sigma factor n=1 Tax=Ktedonospora formicarum TaxID=2778364 RepID=A0A8J3MU33_9CHLR|nr:sigma-70 family RNA polymerase sigma factor [Ktedonospora formicarum]GHO48852.1 RNA polymerase sigma factor [Ktedonospora formicarum]
MFLRRSRTGKDSTVQEDSPQSFQEILKQARQGESEGLSLLYRRFLPGIFGYIAARVPDRATAEDLTSDVFLAMVEGIERQRYDEEVRFTAWLFRIARITVATYYRKHEKQHPTVPLDGTALGGEYAAIESIPDEQIEADPMRWAEERDEWKSVVHAMNQLTEEQRQVLVGRFLLGYDIATVAKIIGKKANAVKALQFRALKNLQRILIPFQASMEHTRRRKGGCNEDTIS